ncbi:MAG: HD domain-containing protein [Candidatus Brocadiia bacterium]
MRERLLQIIPEIELISDAGIRDRVIGVFEKALKKGGWVPDDLLRMPFTLLIKPCPANMAEHIRAVTRVARASAKELTAILGSRLPFDMDVLTAGALLHDIGKLVEYKLDKEGNFVTADHGRMLRHPFSGVGLAYDAGLPDEVLHIIAVHAKEGDGARKTPASFIVNHSDFMTFEPLHK